MAQVLITGSLGFIGRYLADYLISQGISVVGIDKMPCSGKLSYMFEQCNILDLEHLTTVILKYEPDIILHLAARTDLDEKFDIDGYAANIQGVENLISSISKSSSVKRCVFTSSQLVCKVGYIPSSDEDYQPNTLYGESKVLTEKIVREFNGDSVDWCIVRPTTVWGPGMSPHYQKFFRMIEKGRYFHVGDRPLLKSYSYIGNISHQYFMLTKALSQQIHQKTFYLADYEPLSLKNWANAIQRELEVETISTYPEFWVRLAARFGDGLNKLGWESFPFNSFRLNNVLTEYVFDLKKTERICGPLPYSVDAGVRETVSWLKTLKNWP
jgi:GlcNAc-P-P-Und epimerase